VTFLQSFANAIADSLVVVSCIIFKIIGNVIDIVVAVSVIVIIAAGHLDAHRARRR